MGKCHRHLLDVIAQEAVARRGEVPEEGERIAEAATGYKRRTVTGTRTQLAITLYTGMSLQLNLTRVTKQAQVEGCCRCDELLSPCRNWGSHSSTN